jgi:alkyldihydroxyacetonephosphate synthase
LKAHEYLHDMIYSELEDIVGQERVTDKEVDIDAYTVDMWYIPRVHVDRGYELPRPDFVTFPNNKDEVSRIVKLANRYRMPVIPRGGGAGDTGGALAQHGGIILDVTRLDKILQINEYSLTVTSQPGILQVDLEDQLNEKGYTLGHFPASFYCSTLGGFLANRGSGVLSTLYGKIDQMVLSLEAVLPTGEIIRTPPVPDHSTGPDLNKLFLGAEGTLGIITEATLKLHYTPEVRRFTAYLYDNLHHALEAGREIMLNRLRPCVIRVYDEQDTREWIRKVLGFDRTGSYMIIGFDGRKELVEVQERLAKQIIEKHGGEDLGTKWGQQWWDHRYDFYFPPNFLESTPYMHGVIDTVATFDRIETIYLEMKKAIEARFSKWDISFMGHFSHWYDWGAILYPLFIVKDPPDDPDEASKLYNDIFNTGVRVALANGGLVNEHHGIGIKLSRFMEEQYGLAFSVLKKIKQTMDPNNIMNPGKLGF